MFKYGILIMQLGIIDFNNGLCNGIRLLCYNLSDYFIDVDILIRYFKGTRVFLFRIFFKIFKDVNFFFEIIIK